MSEKFKVRRAEKKDISAIMKLLKQVNRVHHEGRPDLFRLTTKYTEEELGRILKNDQTPVFVCEDGNETVLGHGFCILQRPDNTRLQTDILTLYIDDICVDEKARGKHIGKAIYEFVRDYAQSIGCNHITLNVWEGNDPALHFYKNMGMQIQKTTMEVILKQC